jgi:membrane associated rhomboid family serine protease
MALTRSRPPRQPSLWRATTGAVKQHVTVLGGSLAAMWTVFGVDQLLCHSLAVFGVQPWTEQGLWGIFAAPFLHANLAHIVANSLSFLVLGWLVLLRSTRHFFWVTVAATIGGGLAAWLLGAPGSVHIGASGVIFGYFAFLLLGGWFARSFGTMLVSVGVTVLWGGLVFGVLPGQVGVSWQEHLGGFIGGALVAKWLSGRR